MAAGRLEYLRWAFFARPRSDRELYRTIRRRRVRRVVELGIGSIDRALRMIRVCQRYAGGEPVGYTGLDWFEERPADASPLALIEAHRRLKATGAQVRLMPGGPIAGLGSVANSLTQTDLLLIAPEADEASLADAWFFLPRMCGPDSAVLRAELTDPKLGEVRWRPIALDEIGRRAAESAERRAA